VIAQQASLPNYFDEATRPEILPTLRRIAQTIADR